MEWEFWAGLSIVEQSLATLRCGQPWTLEERFTANAMSNDQVERRSVSAFWRRTRWSFAADVIELSRP